MTQINRLFQSKQEGQKDKQDMELTIAFKGLIKKMALCPGQLTDTDFEDFGKKLMFYTHELVHIIFLVNAAKTEAILCHLTSLIDQYMDGD